MKYLLIACFTFIVDCSSAQKINQVSKLDDTLKKYSYYIGFEIVKFHSGGLATAYSGNGTGFFIRQKNGLYFITAKHNIVPCENGEKLFLKKIFIWLQDKQGVPTEKVSIEPFQFNDLVCRQKVNDTDAIVIKVIKPISVNSIESFIFNIPTEYNEVEIWGYPENKKDTSNREDYELISNTHLPANGYSFETLHDTTKNITDWTNSYLVSKTAAIDDLRHGYSGSPVFIKNKKTKKLSKNDSP